MAYALMLMFLMTARMGADVDVPAIRKESIVPCSLRTLSGTSTGAIWTCWPHPKTVWTCADKSRFLLTAEEEKD